MTVKRYEPAVDKYGDGTVIESPYGDFVPFYDYAAAIEQVRLLTEQRDAVVAEFLQVKAINDDRRVFIMNGVQLGYIKVPTVETDPALETIRTAVSPQAETPATSSAIAALRAEGAHFVANRMLAAWEAGFIEDTAKNAADIARMILTSTEFMADAPEGDFDRSFADGVLEDIARQLRESKNLSPASEKSASIKHHALLRECRLALDELISKKPTLGGLLCGSTTLGNLRADLHEFRESKGANHE